MTWFSAILVGLGGSAVIDRLAPAKRQYPAARRAPDTAGTDRPIFDGLAYFFLGYWLVPHDK